MIKFLFLTIPHQCTYENLKLPLKFKQDIYGVTAWTMKLPLTIYSADLKFKHVFKLNQVKVEQLTTPTLQQKWKYFVMTKKDGGKYYCTSQIIYEKRLLKTSEPQNQSQFFSSYTSISGLSATQQFYLPKCIVLISQLPYFKLQVNLLKIHKELKKQEPAISYCIQEDLYETYLEYLQTGKDKEWEQMNLLQINSKRKTFCPLELSFSYYVQCCNSHNSGQCIYIEKATSREVLHLYKLNPSTLYQIGYFFHLPLSALSLRKIISAILTQKQLVFSSSNPNLTVMVIETLMQMILPLKWCYMYVPNLPVELIEAAQQSFMPFIVGIPKQYLALISKSDKIIVNIDNDEVQINYEQEQDQLHMLSRKFEKFLSWKANSNKQYLEWEKQLRINSILMITTIFKKDMLVDRELGMKKYYSEEEKISEEKFYEQFLSKSMMYRKLIQDTHEKVYSQFYKLTKMDFNERKIALQNKFNNLHSQTIYPVKKDNKKQWIKYYETCMRQKRKTRLNRHSLSMVEHNLVGGIGGYYANQQHQTSERGAQFYASNVSLSSISSSNRIQSSQGSSALASYRQPLRNNELYQSTVSSHSLNSHSSNLKFNLQPNISSTKTISPNPIQQSQLNSFRKHVTQPPNTNPSFNNHTFNPTINASNNPTLVNVNSYQSLINRSNFMQSNNRQEGRESGMYSQQKVNPHQSLILNTSPIQNSISQNPLNQSMVTSFITSGQNIHNYPSISTFANTSSQRNLNSTQSTVVL